MIHLIALMALTAPAEAADFIVLAQSDSGCTLFIDGTELVSRGCNLRIQNGDGVTDSANGLGNLIVGYDEGTYASVTGGWANTASDDYTAISGGRINNAVGYGSSVLGGYDQTAQSSYQTVY